MRAAKVLALAMFLLLGTGAAQAAQAPQGPNPFAVVQPFVAEREEEGGVLKIPLKRKREIMFWMGIVLLVSILTTVSLGIAMAVFGKDVFLAHMIFGGLSAALAIVHAATAIAWFWPY